MKCFLVLLVVLSFASCSLLKGRRHHRRNDGHVIVRTDIEKHVTVVKPIGKNCDSQEDSDSDEDVSVQHKSESNKDWIHSILGSNGGYQQSLSNGYHGQDLITPESQDTDDISHLNQIPSWKINKEIQKNNWITSTPKIKISKQFFRNPGMKINKNFAFDYENQPTTYVTHTTGYNTKIPAPNTVPLWGLDRNTFPEWKMNKNQENSNRVESTTLKFTIPETSQKAKWDWVEPETEDIDDFSEVNQTPKWKMNKDIVKNEWIRPTFRKIEDISENNPLQDWMRLNFNDQFSYSQDIDDFSAYNEFLRLKQDENLKEYTKQNIFKPAEAQDIDDFTPADQSARWRINKNISINKWMGPKPQYVLQDWKQMKNQYPWWQMKKHLSFQGSTQPVTRNEDDESSENWVEPNTQDIDDFSPINSFLRWKLNRNSDADIAPDKNREENPTFKPFPWWKIKWNKSFKKWNAPTSKQDEQTEKNQIPLWKFYKNFPTQYWNNPTNQDLDDTKNDAKPWWSMYYKFSKPNFVPWWAIKDSKMGTKLSTNVDNAENPTELNSEPWWKKKKFAMGNWWMMKKRSSPWSNMMFSKEKEPSDSVF